MTPGFISRTTPVDLLKASLDTGAQRVRASADRVAKASVQQRGFALPAAGTAAAPNAQQAPFDLEVEMAGLADEQLRYEATAKLLERTYAGLRESLRDK